MVPSQRVCFFFASLEWNITQVLAYKFELVNQNTCYFLSRNHCRRITINCLTKKKSLRILKDLPLKWFTTNLVHFDSALETPILAKLQRISYVYVCLFLRNVFCSYSMINRSNSPAESNRLEPCCCLCVYLSLKKKFPTEMTYALSHRGDCIVIGVFLTLICVALAYILQEFCLFVQQQM